MPPHQYDGRLHSRIGYSGYISQLQLHCRAIAAPLLPCCSPWLWRADHDRRSAIRQAAAHIWAYFSPAPTSDYCEPNLWSPATPGRNSWHPPGWPSWEPWIVVPCVRHHTTLEHRNSATHIGKAYPGTTLATRMVERHRMAHYRLERAPGRSRTCPYQKR